MTGFPDPAGAKIAAALASATPPGLPAVPVNKVIAIGRAIHRWTPDAIRTVMPREVRETVALYLQGTLDQWFMQGPAGRHVLVQRDEPERGA